MFAKEDMIIYSNRGVCRVTDITVLNQGEETSDRLYYVLAPLNSPSSTMFVPVENQKVVMRSLISRDEAEALIEDIPNVEELKIASEKLREQTYKDCLRTGDCRNYVSMIKTIFLRKQARLAGGKKVTTTDEKYMKLVEEALYSELSQQLELPREKVADQVRSRFQVPAAV